jgi:hypothetical protein
LFLLLVLLGVSFCPTLDDSYVRQVNSQSPEEAILVSNCDPGGKGPTYVSVKVWVPNPFEETATAKLYYKNFTTDDWVLGEDYNVLQYGKECEIFLPLYFGGMGDDTEELEVLRVELTKGSTTYEAEFEIEFEHLRTTKETIVENKTALYLSTLESVGERSFCNSGRSLCCKLQEEYDNLTGLDAQVPGLLKECRVDDARILMEEAVNHLRDIENSASSCSAALAEIATAEATATQRGCNTGAVRTQIDALKSQVRGGTYELSLSALNSAMASQCGGASVTQVQPSDVPATTTGAEEEWSPSCICCSRTPALSPVR